MKNNPYLGPRPFERQHRDRFFGREREGRELQALIVAEREVLFYAQSGAGKSSLLNARVIPGLEDQGYTVLPVARVGNELPPGIDPQAVKNIFVFSALLSLAGAEVDPRSLAGQTLADWLREPCQAALPILIFDQLEELFTSHRERWQDAGDFFRQVRQALDEYPNLGAVFAMREDYLASIDAYIQNFAHRLRARFRMELLGVAGALAAVKQPAQAAGCRFAPGVAERLVDNLREIKVQKSEPAPESDETTSRVLGPSVEPVQLQVVCRRLWENLPETTNAETTIQWADVEQYGDIDRALTDFYESALDNVLTECPNLNEHMVRRWFGRQLITPMETRGLVTRGPENTAGLPNVAVTALESEHIIRADLRAGAHWYELAHDRLIDPILASNRTWEQKQEQLLPWRPDARRWQETHSNSLLYWGKELQDALLWLKTASPGEVEPEEREFLQASQAAERQRRMRTVAFATIALTIALFAGIATWQRGVATLARDQALAAQATAEAARNEAEIQRKTALEAEAAAEAARDEAKKQWQIALAGQLTALAQNYVDRHNPGLAALLAIESLRLKEDSAGSQVLSTALGQLAAPVARVTQAGYVYSVAFSPDGKWVVSGSGDGTTHVWEAATGKEVTHIKQVGAVWSVAFSPDGKWVASGSGDGTTRVWEAATGKEIARMTQNGGVQAVSFSPDGKWVASGSDDGTARVWNPATKQEIAHIALEGGIRTLAFSPNGKQVASGGWDGVARVWEAATGKEIASMTHNNLIDSIAFSPDGKWVVSGGYDGTARVWEAATGQEISRMIQDDGVYSVAFSPDGKWVVSGGYDSTTRIWDAATGEEITRVMDGVGTHRNAIFSPNGQWVVSGECTQYDYTTSRCTSSSAHVWKAATGEEVARMISNADIRSMAFSPDGQWVISGGCDQYDDNKTDDKGNPICLSGSARVWKAAAGQEIARMTQGSRIYKTAVSPDGQWVVSGSGDGTAIVWETATGKEISRITEKGMIYNVAFSSNGKWAASGSSDGHIKIWEAATGRNVSEMMQEGEVWSVDFSPDGKWLVSSGCDQYEETGSADEYPACIAGSARVWKISTGQEIVHVTQAGEIGNAVFSPDGQWVVSGGCDQHDETGTCTSGSARAWEATTGKEIARSTQAGVIWTLAISPDGKWVVSGSEDGTARVWDAATGQEIAQMVHNDWVDSLAISPDGKWVVSGSEDGTARVWESATGKEISRMTKDPGVYNVAFSPDGQWIISGSSNGPARVWEAATGQEKTYIVFDGWVTSGDFSPDGQLVISSGSDGTTRVWRWRSEDLISLACQRLTTNLTPIEWEQFLPGLPYQRTCPNLPEP